MFFVGICGGHVSSTISYGGNFRGFLEAIYYIPLFAVLGIFTAFTIGREYSDGVICNKVIIENTRSEIFLFKLPVSFLVSSMFTTAFLVAYLIETGSVMSGYSPFSVAAKAMEIILSSKTSAPYRSCSCQTHIKVISPFYFLLTEKVDKNRNLPFEHIIVKQTGVSYAPKNRWLTDDK